MGGLSISLRDCRKKMELKAAKKENETYDK